MTQIMEQHEVEQLSKRGRAEYERGVQREKNFKARVKIANTLANLEARAGAALEQSDKDFATAKANWEAAEQAYAQAKVDWATAQAANEATRRAHEGGWSRNQLNLLCDECITEGIGTLHEFWDDARHGSCRTTRTKNQMAAKMKRLEDGMKQLEALKFDPEIGELSELEARVRAIVEEYSR